MKNLQWEVSTRAAEIYYKGRGNTPEEALRDLAQSLEQGVRHATEHMEIQQRRLNKLNEYLEGIES